MPNARRKYIRTNGPVQNIAEIFATLYFALYSASVFCTGMSTTTTTSAVFHIEIGSDIIFVIATEIALNHLASCKFDGYYIGELPSQAQLKIICRQNCKRKKVKIDRCFIIWLSTVSTSSSFNSFM